MSYAFVISAIIALFRAETSLARESMMKEYALSANSIPQYSNTMTFDITHTGETEIGGYPYEER
jgi:hypothetical protein